MQNICMPLLTNPITKFIDAPLGPNEIICFTYQPYHTGYSAAEAAKAIGLIRDSKGEGIYYMCSSYGHGLSSSYGFTNCGSGKEDGDKGSGDLNIIDTYRLYKDSNNGKDFNGISLFDYIINGTRATSANYGFGPRHFYTPDFTESIPDFYMWDFQILYEYSQELAREGIQYINTGRGNTIVKGQSVRCDSNYLIATKYTGDRNSTAIKQANFTSMSLPDLWVNRTCYEMGYIGRWERMPAWWVGTTDFDSQIRNRKLRLQRGGAVNYYT